MKKKHSRIFEKKIFDWIIYFLRYSEISVQIQKYTIFTFSIVCIFSEIKILRYNLNCIYCQVSIIKSIYRFRYFIKYVVFARSCAIICIYLLFYYKLCFIASIAGYKRNLLLFECRVNVKESLITKVLLFSTIQTWFYQITESFKLNYLLPLKYWKTGTHNQSLLVFSLFKLWESLTFYVMSWSSEITQNHENFL